MMLLSRPALNCLSRVRCQPPVHINFVPQKTLLGSLPGGYAPIDACAAESMKVPPHMTVVALVSLAAVAVVVTGCGGASKPEYCSNVSELEESVDDLRNVQLESGFLATLEADVNKVREDADAVVSSAKEDFPSETSALESSVSVLAEAINKLPPSPTTGQLLSLTPRISSTVKAAEELVSATESACE
jgi:hypothetical protein